MLIPRNARHVHPLPGITGIYWVDERARPISAAEAAGGLVPVLALGAPIACGLRLRLRVKALDVRPGLGIIALARSVVDA